MGCFRDKFRGCVMIFVMMCKDEGTIKEVDEKENENAKEKKLKERKKKDRRYER